MVKYLVKANSKGICHCKCRTALVAHAEQLDCPWCGCGWLFTCMECRAAFTYARVVDVPHTYEELARISLAEQHKPYINHPNAEASGARQLFIESAADPDKIRAIARNMADVVAEFEFGDRVVFLDERYVKLSGDPIWFYGRKSEHNFEKLPHWRELQIPGSLSKALASRRYWQRTKLPEILIIAGPNGAGKTSFARSYLANSPEITFVNADEVAKEIEQEGLSQPRRDLLAGRKVLQRIDDLAAARASFALETTLATRHYAPKIRSWWDAGYNIALIYLKLPSVEASLERVERRVRAGGHGIPEDALRRRFDKSWDYFESIYKPLVTEWYVWESLEGEFRPLMSSNGLLQVQRKFSAQGQVSG